MKFQPYKKTLNYLATHKKLPYFLSHGCIHLVVLILLLVIIGYLGCQLFRMSIKNLAVIDTSIEFLNQEDNKKYPLRHFEMIFKADSIADYDTVLIKAKFHDYHDSCQKYINIFEKPIVWTWIMHFQNELVFYKNMGVTLPKGYENQGKYERLHNGWKLTFYRYDFFAITDKKTSGNILADNKDNPYYSAYIRFSQQYLDVDSTSYITIDLSKSKLSNSIITFDKIFPEPSELYLNKFSYRGKEKIEEILKNGYIFFEAKDIARAYRSDRYYLVISVLMGTLIAFCLDIIIKLIYKWRRVGIKEDEN